MIPGTADLEPVARQGRLQHLHQKLPRQLLHLAVLGIPGTGFDFIQYGLAQKARSLLTMCHLTPAQCFVVCSCICMSKLVHADDTESCRTSWMLLAAVQFMHEACTQALPDLHDFAKLTSCALFMMYLMLSRGFVCTNACERSFM